MTMAAKFWRLPLSTLGHTRLDTGFLRSTEGPLNRREATSGRAAKSESKPELESTVLAGV